MSQYNADDVSQLLEHWQQLKNCSHVNNFKFAIDCQRQRAHIDDLASKLRQLVFDDADSKLISISCTEFSSIIEQYSQSITVEILKNGSVFKPIPKPPAQSKNVKSTL